MKKSMILTIALGALALAFYIFGVEPSESSLERTNRELADIKIKHETMERNLAGANLVKQRIAKCEEEFAPYRAELLEPLLESYAMRAKSIIDSLAIGAGLTETEYSELPTLALPLPKRQLKQLHMRCPVRLVCRGSFQAFVSFLRQLEEAHPLVTMQSLQVSVASDNGPQIIETILEWPAKGAVISK